MTSLSASRGSSSSSWNTKNLATKESTSSHVADGGDWSFHWMSTWRMSRATQVLTTRSSSGVTAPCMVQGRQGRCCRWSAMELLENAHMEHVVNVSTGGQL
jgi:hypothetical protein